MEYTYFPLAVVATLGEIHMPLKNFYVATVSVANDVFPDVRALQGDANQTDVNSTFGKKEEAVVVSPCHCLQSQRI